PAIARSLENLNGAIEKRTSIRIGESRRPFTPGLRDASWSIFTFSQPGRSIEHLLNHFFIHDTGALPQAPDAEFGAYEFPMPVCRRHQDRRDHGDPQPDRFHLVAKSLRKSIGQRLRPGDPTIRPLPDI